MQTTVEEEEEEDEEEDEEEEEGAGPPTPAAACTAPPQSPADSGAASTTPARSGSSRVLQVDIGPMATATSSASLGAEKLNIFLAPFVTNFEPATDKRGKLKLPKGREFRAMICGLTGAGKTMLVMQCEKRCEITWAASLTPVEGEMTMYVHARNNLILWDMSGTVEGRAAWGQHIEDQDFRALIFVVDCTQKTEMPTAVEELNKVLSSPNLGPNVPLVVLANKQDTDIPEADKMDAYQVADALQLATLGRRWRVQECSATLGHGVEQSFDWLCMAEGTKPRKKESELLQADAAQIIKAYADRQQRASARALSPPSADFLDAADPEPEPELAAEPDAEAAEPEQAEPDAETEPTAEPDARGEPAAEPETEPEAEPAEEGEAPQTVPSEQA